jgi:hypothetical protein
MFFLDKKIPKMLAGKENVSPTNDECAFLFDGRKEKKGEDCKSSKKKTKLTVKKKIRGKSD